MDLWGVGGVFRFEVQDSDRDGGKKDQGPETFIYGMLWWIDYDGYKCLS